MKNKNKLLALNKRFFKTSNLIFYIGLSPNSVALFCMLSSLPEEHDINITYVSKVLGMSRTTVYKCIEELKDRKVLYYEGSRLAFNNPEYYEKMPRV